MYFNFEDYRPDTPTLPRSLTRLEVCLLTVVVYLSMVILLLVWPNLPFVQAWEAERQQALAKQQEQELQRQREHPRFVFVAPRVDLQARRPPERAELSDIDRKARTKGRPQRPNLARLRPRSPNRKPTSRASRCPTRRPATSRELKCRRHSRGVLA
jgi:hypothetical protein